MPHFIKTTFLLVSLLSLSSLSHAAVCGIKANATYKGNVQNVDSINYTRDRGNTTDFGKAHPLSDIQIVVNELFEKYVRRSLCTISARPCELGQSHLDDDYYIAYTDGLDEVDIIYLGSEDQALETWDFLLEKGICTAN